MRNPFRWESRPRLGVFFVPVTGGGMNGSMARPVSATSLNMLAANVTMWAVMMVAMMLLMFVGGVMNLAWMAAQTL